jgi:hypothetical protein
MKRQLLYSMDITSARPFQCDNCTELPLSSSHESAISIGPASTLKLARTRSQQNANLLDLPMAEFAAFIETLS